MDNIKEVWKDIEFTEGLYEVSNLGRVRSTDYLIEANGGSYIHKGRILKQHLANNGEMMVCIGCAQLGLKRNQYLINRLVALAFITNHNNLPQAIHINGNNLDNRVENLQWATHTECVRKDTAQYKRSNTLKEIKAGTMPNDNFMKNQHIGHLKSQEKRKKSVEVWYPDGSIRIFKTVRDAEITLCLSRGYIHTIIKRGNDGIGRSKNYTFKF